MTTKRRTLRNAVDKQAYARQLVRQVVDSQNVKVNYKLLR